MNEVQRARTPHTNTDRSASMKRNSKSNCFETNQSRIISSIFSRSNFSAFDSHTHTHIHSLTSHNTCVHAFHGAMQSGNRISMFELHSSVVTANHSSVSQTVVYTCYRTIFDFTLITLIKMYKHTHTNKNYSLVRGNSDYYSRVCCSLWIPLHFYYVLKRRRTHQVQFWLASHNDFWPIFFFILFSKPFPTRRNRNLTKKERERKNAHIFFLFAHFDSVLFCQLPFFTWAQKPKIEKLTYFRWAKSKEHTKRAIVSEYTYQYLNLLFGTFGAEKWRHSFDSCGSMCDSNKRNLQLHVRCVISVRLRLACKWMLHKDKIMPPSPWGLGVLTNAVPNRIDSNRKRMKRPIEEQIMCK